MMSEPGPLRLRESDAAQSDLTVVREIRGESDASEQQASKPEACHPDSGDAIDSSAPQEGEVASARSMADKHSGAGTSHGQADQAGLGAIASRPLCERRPWRSLSGSRKRGGSYTVANRRCSSARRRLMSEPRSRGPEWGHSGLEGSPSSCARTGVRSRTTSRSRAGSSKSVGRPAEGSHSSPRQGSRASSQAR